MTLKNRLLLALLTMTMLQGCVGQKNVDLSNKKNTNESSSRYRDSLITVAKSLITENAGHNIPPDYRSKVYTDNNNIWVLFFTEVQYAPMGSIYNYNAEVELNTRTFSFQTINNSKRKLEGQSIPFYSIKPKDLDTIGLISKSLNVANPFESDLYELFRIIEKKNAYEVVIETIDTKSEYTINKLDGEVKSLGHRPIKIPSPSKRGLIEIK